MWLTILGVVLAALILAGSFLFGGVFTIVTIPVVLGAGLLALFWRVLARSLQEKKNLTESSGPVPPSIEANPETRQRPSNPSDLVDARRTAQ
jgi:hypothetical protein